MYGKQLPDGTTDGATVDGTHATPVFYHRWTMRVLAAAERQLKTGCLLPGALDPTPRPVPRPTRKPTTPQPSRKPVADRRPVPSLARVAAMASARECRGSRLARAPSTRHSRADTTPDRGARRPDAQAHEEANAPTVARADVQTVCPTLTGTHSRTYK